MNLGKYQTMKQFFATQSVQVPIWGLAMNLILVAIFSYILNRVYIKYGSSLSNRRVFAKNFMFIAMTTTLVISIIKSSLALSLGMVGALSIVRFRAAIKEPEELSYLFLSIALGLGFGADQRISTMAAFVVIVGVIVLRSLFRKPFDNANLYLTVASSDSQKVTLEKIIQILKKHCTAVDMKRFDEGKDMLEASFLIELKDFEHISAARSELQGLSDSLRITFLDNKGII